MGARRAEDLDSLVRELRAERWWIQRRLAARARSERELSADQHDTPMDPAERGSDLQAIDLTERLADRSARRFEELTLAIDRAAQGRLGTCESCGGPIPVARLRALPGAVACVTCAGREDESGTRPVTGELAVGPAPERAVLPGRRVYTGAGEGIAQRLAPFGTCGQCGETEGRYDDDSGEVLCSSPGCDAPLEDVEELWVVEVGEETITARPEQVRPVDLNPYD